MLTADSTSSGAPVDPSRQSHWANLSTRSPVSSPKSAGQCPFGHRPRGGVPWLRTARPRGKVWLTLAMQTRKFGGSMLHWVTKSSQASAHLPIGCANSHDVVREIDPLEIGPEDSSGDGSRARTDHGARYPCSTLSCQRSTPPTSQGPTRERIPGLPGMFCNESPKRPVPWARGG